MPTPPVFFTCAIECYAAGGSTISIDQSIGSHPIGTLAQLPDAIEQTVTIYASDMGYRTRESDAGGLVAYPPLLTDAFHITAAMNLDPTRSGTAAAAGSLILANPNGRWDSLATSLNSDGRPVTVRYGQKTMEDFDGYATKRATTGTYIDASGVMQTAAAGVVRYDWSSGSPVALNEPAETNLIPNANTGDPGWQSVASTDIAALYSPATVWKVTSLSSGYNAGAFTGIAISANTEYVFSAWVYVPAAWGGGDIDANFDSGSTLVTISAQKADLSIRNKWQRIYIHVNSGSETTMNAVLRQESPYDAGQNFYHTCWQVKQGSTPTSYIPTTGTAATRAADNLYTARGILLDPPLANLATAWAGVAAPWQLSETDLTIPLRDATALLERPYQTNTYDGTGGLNGTADLAGRPIPRTRGGTVANPVRNVTPVLIDPVALIYQWTDGPGELVALYEGAAKTITFSADVTDLYSGSTPAGQYRTDKAKGLFQLGSPPASGYAITCDVTGAFLVAGAVTTPAGIARYLLAEDMALPAANIDTASFDAAATAYPYTAGLYFDGASTITGVQALDAILAGWLASVIPARDGTLKLLVLRAPPSTATPVASYDTAELVSLTPHQLPAAIDPPVGQIKVAYSHNYTVQTTGLNTTTATSDQQQFVAAADRYASWSSADVLAAWRSANRLTLASPLLSQSDAQAVANDLGTLLGTRLRSFDAQLPASIAATREMGETISLAFPIQDLAGGRLARIVGYDFHSTDPTITLQVLL